MSTDKNPMTTIHQAEIVNDDTTNPELMPAKREQGEIVKLPEQRATPQELRVVEVNEALLPAYQKAATLELTDAEIEALQAPFPDELVEIRPHDGLIYIPHIHISNRFNKVFKPGKWALICRRHWLEGNTMYGEYVLVVRGCYVGESVGGHPYQPTNPKVNYSDTLESTAAEALRRIAGKRLSCGSQVWEPEYARQWCENHSAYTNGKYARKFGATPPKTSPKPPERPQTPTAQQNAPESQPALKPATVEQRDKMIAMFESEGAEAVQKALGYFIDAGIILPNEQLKDVPLDYVPTMASHMRELGVLIAQCNDQGKAVKPSWVKHIDVADPKKPIEVPRERALPLDSAADEPWRTFPMPFGKNAGKPLADLPKNYLYGLWANYEVEEEYNGKPKRPETIAKDEEFREMLDAAGEHYSFKED